MEASHEELVGSSNDNQTHDMIVKGKRTKRQRAPSSPLISSSSSSAVGERGDEYYANSFSSPTTSGGANQVYDSTEEEEDMANCLILLAQGNHYHHHQQQQQRETAEDQKLIAGNISTNKAGLFIYECKTCNRTFPSFQALGGHRASHKKPKITAGVVDHKKPTIVSKDLEDNQEEHHVFLFNKNLQKMGITTTTTITTTTNKVHECSICGSEFNSGQALGGHMRRHRVAATVPPNSNVIMSIAAPSPSPVSVSASASVMMKHNSSSLREDVEIIKHRRPNILPLDLNLPAPEDDHRSGGESKFALVFSGPALVDCHY